MNRYLKSAFLGAFISFLSIAAYGLSPAKKIITHVNCKSPFSYNEIDLKVGPKGLIRSGAWHYDSGMVEVQRFETDGQVLTPTLTKLDADYLKTLSSGYGIDGSFNVGEMAQIVDLGRLKQARGEGLAIAFEADLKDQIKSADVRGIKGNLILTGGDTETQIEDLNCSIYGE